MRKPAPTRITSLTLTVKLPTHGNGPQINTVPPASIKGCKFAVSVATTPVHVYELTTAIAGLAPNAKAQDTSKHANTSASNDRRLPRRADPKTVISILSLIFRGADLRGHETD